MGGTFFGGTLRYSCVNGLRLMILCQNRFPGQRRRRRYGHCPSGWSHTSSFFVWRHIWRFWFVCRNEFINVKRIRKPFHDMVNALLATGLSNPLQFQTLQMASCQKELALAKIKPKVRYPSSLIHQLSKFSLNMLVQILLCLSFSLRCCQ